MQKKRRIMHGMVEAAGQNTYSVQGLKLIGEHAETVVYAENPFGYKYDKCLSIDKSKRPISPVTILKLLAFYFSALKKYNTFHFHFGSSILNNYELWSYDLFHKDYYYEFHGSDLRDLKKACEIMGMPYNSKYDGGLRLQQRNRKICKKAKGIIIHDDELIPYLPLRPRNLYVVPLRVDISKFEPKYPACNNELIRIVHAPSNKDIKGTKYIIDAIDILKKKYNNIEFILVEGKKQQEAFEIYKEADIIVDQLFLGTYGVFAIESMALGKPVVSCISETMRSRFPKELPIVNGDMTNIVEALELLINNPKLRVEKGRQGRKYVEDYHDFRIVAHILKGIYYGTGEPLTGRDAFEQVKALKQQMESNR